MPHAAPEPAPAGRHRSPRRWLRALLGFGLDALAAASCTGGATPGAGYWCQERHLQRVAQRGIEDLERYLAGAAR